MSSIQRPLPPSLSPPEVQCCLLSYPAPWILLVTINRERQMNSIPWAGHWEMDALWSWFDEEPNLRVAVITGAGNKSFSAGQDLIELGSLKGAPAWQTRHPPSGFAGLSRRGGKKPVIAAVNGYAFGGGFETTLNCDAVVASPTAQFALTEVSRGIFAGAGGLARLIRTCGLQVASEIALSGRRVSAQEALRIGLVNKISVSVETVVDEAIELARTITRNSPDAIIVSRKALRQSWESGSVERSVQLIADDYTSKLLGGENAREGLQAFAEKREPEWKPSKL
ncbi:uncharacterized protein A1O5_01345 [Cladophialophora psammophila CBS 110553]|uniref:Enoyl-CoA hydratase n=1 Tax=Cladophialophora psammophila CBS 110553 TaxID=1182543 RepID=W9X2E6_9EURO|nr:uncharacterized protein A1O5_01345 [Cladophialophora psammophila CBS 110553]EXJ74652.1 hypothetical protein A1O5_01345 [Cladophialophora psammophila CBS 110553]